MTQLYVLLRRSWGDFDMPYDTPVAVSESKPALLLEGQQRQSKLTEQQKREEIAHHVAADKVMLLAATPDPLPDVTKEELAMALADLLDGQSTAEHIVNDTGLDLARATEISNLYNNGVRAYANLKWNT